MSGKIVSLLGETYLVRDREIYKQGVKAPTNTAFRHILVLCFIIYHHRGAVYGSPERLNKRLNENLDYNLLHSHSGLRETLPRGFSH